DRLNLMDATAPPRSPAQTSGAFFWRDSYSSVKNATEHISPDVGPRNQNSYPGRGRTRRNRRPAVQGLRAGSLLRTKGAGAARGSADCRAGPVCAAALSVI